MGTRGKFKPSDLHRPIAPSDETPHPSSTEDQEARDRAHGLTEGILYGPVESRRYGLNFGINLLGPSRKHCNWNCVYCQLGYSSYSEEEPEGLPTPVDLRSALLALDAGMKLRAFVVCGNGEPTLHPEFPKMVDVLRETRAQRFPEAQLVCLTNGGEAWRPSVLAALKRFDEVGLKMDAGNERLLHRVNLPIRPTSVEHQIRTAKRLEGAVVQSCFFQGPVDNTTEDAVRPWIEAVARAMPTRVDIYTLSRSSPARKLRPAPAARLIAIANSLRALLDVPVRVFGPSGELDGS